MHFLPRQDTVLHSFAQVPILGCPVGRSLTLSFAAMHNYHSPSAWSYMTFKPDQHEHSNCVWLVDSLQGGGCNTIGWMEINRG